MADMYNVNLSAFNVPATSTSSPHPASRATSPTSPLNNNIPRKPITPQKSPSSSDDEDSSTSASEDEDEGLRTQNIRGVIIALWDNTVGPKPLKVWNGGGMANSLEPELITFLTRFTINDEISREEEIGKGVDIKFNFLQDVGILVLTSVFVAKYGKGNSVFTLSLVISKSHFTKFMALQSILRERMILLTKVLQKACNSIPLDMVKALEKFEGQLRDFVSLYDVLHSAGVFVNNLNETLFSHPAKETAERDFLAHAITAHLQTHGHSVVVGHEPKEIALWVNTLSLFLMPKEKMLCRYGSKGDIFKRELVLQGLIAESTDVNKGASTSSNGSYNSKQSGSGKTQKKIPAQEAWRMIPIERVLAGEYPISVIDLTQRQVRSFKLFNYFDVLKSDYRAGAHHMHPSPNSGNPKQIDMQHYKVHFSPVTTIVPSVKQLLERIYTIPPQIRLGYIAEWMRELTRKALVLAKFIEKASTEAKMNTVTSVPKLALKHCLDLHAPLSSTSTRYGGTGDDELNIILAATEKIRPGSYMAVTGNPQIEADSVMEFLDNV